MTRNVRFSNNAVSKLASSITSTSTTITLQTGDGSKFPTLAGSQYFMATLIKSDGSTEVVKVTARSSDTLTVVRAAEAVGGIQTAYAFSIGDRVEHRLTSGALSGELDRLDQAALISALNKSANYTITASDVTSLVRVDSSSAAITITLPQISTLTDDFDVIVAKVTGDSNFVTITRSGTDTINGANTYPLTNQWQAAWLTADRSTGAWTVISSGSAGLNITVDAFTGSGSAGPFTLTGNPGAKANTAVYVGGVYQQKSTYTLSGTSLTLGGTVASGVPIEIVWAQPLSIGVPAEGSVTPSKLSTGGPTWDAGGNLGLGVTPSGWGGAFKAIDIHSLGSVGGTIGGAYLAFNAYYDSASVWRYKNSQAAGLYSNELGTHKWAIAPTGTAGAPITFTQAMTLDSSGVLSVPGGIEANVTRPDSGAIVGITQGTSVASTSGTAIDLTGIPSWVKRVTVMLNGVSTTGTNNLIFQLGAGSAQTTGYQSSSSALQNAAAVYTCAYTTGFVLTPTAATDYFSGSITFFNVGGNVWVGSGLFVRYNGVPNYWQVNLAGIVSLSGVLSRVRITSVSGVDTFDAGSINILYE